MSGAMVRVLTNTLKTTHQRVSERRKSRSETPSTDQSGSVRLSGTRRTIMTANPQRSAPQERACCHDLGTRSSVLEKFKMENIG